MQTSKELFHAIAKRLNDKIAGLNVVETDKWYSFYQKGGKKFAYCSLAKRTAKISFWCLGNVDEIKHKYYGKIDFLKRRQSTGGFGKDFQTSFFIDNDDKVTDVVNLLVEISNSWTKEELISAYNLYCKIPVSEINNNNKSILNFADLLGKTPKEIVKKFKNFSKLDVIVQVLNNTDNEDVNTWNLFNTDWKKAVYESEKNLFYLENKLNKISNFPKGKEREKIVSMRVNQTFFRMAILTSYQNKCCITQLPFTELLNASHIIPWASDEANRLNPHNGLCLNTLHDRAFDRGFITVLPNYTINISDRICEVIDNKSVIDYFIKFKNKKIFLPNRFLPEKSFLEYHNQNIFKK
jgi:putative restriction endonuclease